MLAPSTLAVIWSNVTSMFAAAVVDRVIGDVAMYRREAPEVPHHRHYIPRTNRCTSCPQGHAAAIFTDHLRCRWMRPTRRRDNRSGSWTPGLPTPRNRRDTAARVRNRPGAYLGPPKTKTSVRTVEGPAVTDGSARPAYRTIPASRSRDLGPHQPDRRKHHRRIARLISHDRRSPDPPGHLDLDAGHLPRAKRISRREPVFIALRHYFATLLIHSGAGVKRVQLALGHSTPTITLNTYVGEWPDTDGQTRAIVDSALGRVPRVCPDRPQSSKRSPR